MSSAGYDRHTGIRDQFLSHFIRRRTGSTAQFPESTSSFLARQWHEEEEEEEEEEKEEEFTNLKGPRASFNHWCEWSTSLDSRPRSFSSFLYRQIKVEKEHVALINQKAHYVQAVQYCSRV